MKSNERELVEKKLVDWFGTEPTVLHFYELDGTYIYLVQFNGKLFIVRIFWVFNRMELSQDAMFYPKDFKAVLPELEKQAY